MSNAIFEADSYIEILRTKLEEPGTWGLISRTAEAAQCQRSHLSRVLSERVHLTPEQAERLCAFWKLDEAESDYFMELVDLARAGSPQLRTRIEKKLKRLKREQENLGSRLRHPSLGAGERESIYYSAWHWSAIHILVSIPEFQTVAAIARRLTLAEPQVLACLKQLESFKLVERRGEKWRISSESIHLPRDSALISLHHNNWRQRAALASQNPASDGLHYSVVQSVSRRDVQKLKQLLLATIDAYSKVAAKSAEEELICFNCDLFRA